jgi:transposase
MILNGLGFVAKPLSLTPLFFRHKALAVLFHPGVTAADFNRFKLGRTLDQIFAYGADRLFSELAFAACVQENVDQRFNSADTTTFAVTGDCYPDSDEHAVKITHGYSKDHRPDLRQAVHELMVSQDGGVPLLMQTWSGNESDTLILRERTKALVHEFNHSNICRYLIADSKLYDAGNAPHLAKLYFITRIPSKLKKEQELIQKAIGSDTWQRLDNDHQYICHTLTHYDITQRWLVVRSQGSITRANKTIKRRVTTEAAELTSRLKKLTAMPFTCKDDAMLAVQKMQKGVRYHTIELVNIAAVPDGAKQGRMTSRGVPSEYKYQVHTQLHRNEQAIQRALDQSSCYVIGTNIPEQELADQEVITAYKGQNTSIENKGFRFLKDAVFFTSALFIKKPSRIMSLLFIMTLSLLVYSIAQRRLRHKLAATDNTLPNQIDKEIKNPTLRWIFQLMEGVNIIKILSNGVTKYLTNGLSTLQRKIIGLFGDNVTNVYLKYAQLDTS